MENAPPPDVHCLAEGAMQLRVRQLELIVCHARLVDEQCGVLSRFDEFIRGHGVGGEPGRARSVNVARSEDGGRRSAGTRTRCSSHQNV